VKIIDFADGDKLILLDERDKFYDCATLTRYLIFDKPKYESMLFRSIYVVPT